MMITDEMVKAVHAALGYARGLYVDETEVRTILETALSLPVQPATLPPFTHRLNPETGRYDRTPEFKALMAKLTDEERGFLIRIGLKMSYDPSSLLPTQGHDQCRSQLTMKFVKSRRWQCRGG